MAPVQHAVDIENVRMVLVGLRLDGLERVWRRSRLLDDEMLNS